MLTQGAIGQVTPPAEAPARRRLVAVQRAGGISPLLPAAGARPSFPDPHDTKGPSMNMTAATVTPSDTPSMPNGGSLIVDIRLPRRLVIVVALAAIADWLFYDHPVGISVVVALLVLTFGAALASPMHVARRDLPVTGLVLVAALLPFAVEPSLL